LAETVNVVGALAIQNVVSRPTGQNFECNAKRGNFANAVERALTN